MSFIVYLPTPRHAQSGVALLVAMIVLIVMSLAGVALIRSVDTNALIASNLSFRQNAQYAGDRGVEAAIAWLQSGGGALLSDSSANGYSATRSPSVDLTGNVTANSSDNVQWMDHDGTVQTGSATPICLDKDGADNRVCYVIHRMCTTPGPVTITNCGVFSGIEIANAKAPPESHGARDSNLNYGSAGRLPEKQSRRPVFRPIYRITTRTAGPRNNLSFVQVYVAI